MPQVHSAATGVAAAWRRGSSVTEEDDGLFLRRYVEGEGEARERAFAELVCRHGGLVLGHCRRQLGEAQAEDAAQAVFLILARKAPGLCAEGSLSGWLFRTADLVTRTMKRDRRTRSRHEDRARTENRKTPVAEPDAETVNAMRGVLDEALKALRAPEREAVLLHYLEGLPQKDAALRLGLGYDAYRQRLSRALERMRVHLCSRGIVLSATMLGAGLLEIGRADGAAAAPLQAVLTQSACGTHAASAAVQSLVKGATSSMLRTSLVYASGAAAVAAVVMASALWAADRAPAKPAPAPVAPAVVPASTVTGGEAAKLLAGGHVVLPGVKATGLPVFSPDGRWLAVRERSGHLAVIDLLAAVKDPKAEPARYELAPGIKMDDWSGRVFGEAAAFTADSKRVVFAGKDGLVALALPPTGAPEPIVVQPGNRKLGREYVLALSPHAAAGEPCIALLKFDPSWAPKEDAPPPQPVLALLKLGPPVSLSEGLKVRAQHLAWTHDSKRLLAVLDDGSAGVIDVATGKVASRLDVAAFSKTVGLELEYASTKAAFPDGSFLAEGVRPYPAFMRDRTGTYIPDGDEKAERGLNPGSAEQGPPMPAYLYRFEGEKKTRIWLRSVARCIDTLMVEPSPRGDAYFYFQVTNTGGAGSGTPHVWVGKLDAAGKRTEKDLGNPFKKGVDAPMFQLLSLTGDASNGLVLMRALRDRRFEKKVDAETRKQILDDLHSGKLQAASIYGDEGVVESLASSMLMSKYERNGGYEDGKLFVMKFATWQVWSVDAAKMSMTPVTPEFGEAIGEMEGVTGLPGAPIGYVGEPCSAYSEQAGLVAMALQGASHDPKSDDSLESRGLVLLKVEPK